MTPDDAFNALVAQNDQTLAKIKASLARIEAQKVAREQGGLLAEVAAKIESEPAFRASVIWLACD
jgi:hypothetical protein